LLTWLLLLLLLLRLGPGLSGHLWRAWLRDVVDGACLRAAPCVLRRVCACAQQGAQPAERFIRDLVECEQQYINTDNPAFIGGTRAVKEVMEDREARRQAAAAAASNAEAQGGGRGKGGGGGEGRQVR
jgi:hypothetical protein